jgi:hypothetical protein
MIAPDQIPNAQACPLCQSEMAWRDVSPCMECGGDSRELRMLDDRAHSYDEVKIFGQFPIVLCDFCQIDFGTNSAYFFGLPRHQHLGFNDLQVQRPVAPRLSQDWVCNGCGYRAAFMDFVLRLRAHFKLQKKLDQPQNL